MALGVDAFVLMSCVFIVSVTNAAPANVSDVNELLQVERAERIRLQDEVNTLEDKLSEIDNRMQRDADWMLSKSKFAFSATRTNNVNVYARQTLIFDKVHTNMGNIYNPIFGHLTVPVNGTYSVGVKIVAQSGKTLDMYLMKDTEQVHRFYFGDTSNGHYEANTVNLILKLTRGNVLYVQGRNNPDHVGLESAFSSVLLFT